MCVVVTPAMSAATAETCGELLVPAAVDRFAGQRECRHRLGDERSARCGSAPPAAAMHLASAIKRGVEQPTRGKESLDPGAQLGGEEAGVGGGQHRGEHPEGVVLQLIRVDRAERRRHHRHRWGGVAQVVEPDRVHAERREQVGDVGEFARVPTRIAPWRSRGQSRLVVAAQFAVHLGTDFEKCGVGRHLGAVHAGQRGREFRAQPPGFDTFAHRARPEAIQCRP